MTPGLLTGTRCMVVVFVKVGNKETYQCLVGRKKIKLSSKQIRLRCQSVYETFKWRRHISSCIYTPGTGRRGWPRDINMEHIGILVVTGTVEVNKINLGRNKEGKGGNVGRLSFKEN